MVAQWGKWKGRTLPCLSRALPVMLVSALEPDFFSPGPFHSRTCLVPDGSWFSGPNGCFRPVPSVVLQADLPVLRAPPECIRFVFAFQLVPSLLPCGHVGGGGRHSGPTTEPGCRRAGHLPLTAVCRRPPVSSAAPAAWEMPWEEASLLLPEQR